MVTILQIAVQVLLLGLFMPSVRISLRILSCEEDPEDPAQRVLKMDGEACTISPRVDTLGAIGLSMFVLYGILPYLTMACVMIREAARGSLRRKLRESDTFFMLFGWAAAPYKESAFFWESVNAATIVSDCLQSFLPQSQRWRRRRAASRVSDSRRHLLSYCPSHKETRSERRL